MPEDGFGQYLAGLRGYRVTVPQRNPQLPADDLLYLLQKHLATVSRWIDGKIDRHAMGEALNFFGTRYRAKGKVWRGTHEPIQDGKAASYTKEREIAEAFGYFASEQGGPAGFYLIERKAPAKSLDFAKLLRAYATGKISFSTESEVVLFNTKVTGGNGTITQYGPAINPQGRRVTDRALRYRANKTPPDGPRRCLWCGHAKVMVGHLDGHEENNGPDNLVWTCRSCNGKMGVQFKRARLGRRTRQYNPAAKPVGRPAESMGQWALAVQSMKGESDAMTVAAAVEMIRATTAAARSAFARKIWALRRQRGTA